MNDFTENLNAIANVVDAILLYGTARYAYLTVKLSAREHKGDGKREAIAIGEAPVVVHAGPVVVGEEAQSPNLVAELALEQRLEDLPPELGFWA